MKELDVHSAMITAARETGGFGLKMNNRFQVGVADLLIKVPDRETTIIEVKILNSAMNMDSGRRFRVDLTPHQCRFLRDHQRAGGLAGWMVVGKMKSPFGAVKIAVSTGLPPRDGSFDASIDDNVRWVVRMRGTPWPVKLIIEYLIATRR